MFVRWPHQAVGLVLGDLYRGNVEVDEKGGHVSRVCAIGLISSVLEEESVCGERGRVLLELANLFWC